MANYPNYNLYGKRPADTFRNIVQFNITASNLVDSYGDELPPISISASVSGTSSWANNSVNSISASWAPDQTVTVNSASWASQSLSASWAPFTDTGTTLVTASTYQITASSAISASWAPSATQVEQISASWASSSLSASYIATASYAPTVVQGTNTFLEQHITFVQNSGSVDRFFIDSTSDLKYTPSSGKLVVGGISTDIVTASLFYGTASSAISASWAPFTQVEQISASWASQSLSASVLFNSLAFVDLNGYAQFGTTTLSQSFGPTLTFDNPTLSNEFENTPAGILEFNCNEWSGSGARRTVARITATKDGTVPYGGASGLFVIATEDTSGAVMDRLIINRFATSFSGSVVATEPDNYGRAGFTGSLNGTASNALNAVSSSYAVTASWAPTSITYPLTVLASNLTTASIDFLAGQYFQLDTTASMFTFGNSTNVTAVRNASVYITPQSGSRTIVFNPSWIVMGNFPTTIAHNSASILSLTTFGSNDASVVAAFASKV